MEIEKGVATPPKGPITIYPFARMDIGDSFFVPGEFREDRKRPIMAAYSHRRRHMRGGEATWDFQSRTVEVDGAKGVRIWRIK